MRQVSIHSDGTARGTTVLTESGEQLDNITELSVSMSSEGGIRATLEMTGTINLNTQALVEDVTFHCQLCSGSTDHICDVSFGDGSSPVFTQGHVVSVQCPSRFSFRGENSTCIRQAGHDKKHFDGERIWV